MFKKAGLIYCMLVAGNLLLIVLHGCRCKTDLPTVCREPQSLSLEIQDNGGKTPEAVKNSTVYAKALMLTISLNEVSYHCHIPRSPFFNSAYAMCKAENTLSNYGDKAVFIYSDRDYDAAHPAGADLKDLFRVSGENYYLLSAPDDTSGLYTFVAQLRYQLKYQPDQDTLFANTPRLKLKK